VQRVQDPDTRASICNLQSKSICFCKVVSLNCSASSSTNTAIYAQSHAQFLGTSYWNFRYSVSAVGESSYSRHNESLNLLTFANPKLGAESTSSTAKPFASRCKQSVLRCSVEFFRVFAVMSSKHGVSQSMPQLLRRHAVKAEPLHPAFPKSCPKQ